MTDIRSRAAEALREHQPSDVGFCTADGCNWRYWPGHDHKEHQIDVLLASGDTSSTVSVLFATED